MESIPSFMKDLIINKEQGDYPFPIPTPDVTSIKPEQGFCLKTKDKHGTKIFINFCHSTKLPAPKNITEEELSELITNSVDENQVNYRVPISLGEPKDAVDKCKITGQSCTAHDVVVNSEFYKKLEKSDLFKHFVIQVAFEGLEDKYKTEFIKNKWVILQNKKYMGVMSDVIVRTESKKPLITEISSTSNNEVKEFRENDTLRTKYEGLPSPVYEMVQEPPEGYPTHIVAEFKMPLVHMTKEIQLDLGEDRILVCVPTKYFLDIFLPYNIKQDESGAQFNPDTSTLTLTMAIVAKNSKA
uniref:PIH1 domain-containing protein 1 n=1 Tax=Strigamia maritima TaxID=126957 RepID=T1J758_STRMM